VGTARPGDGWRFAVVRVPAARPAPFTGGRLVVFGLVAAGGEPR
jgi:hypothetical protein